MFPTKSLTMEHLSKYSCKLASSSTFFVKKIKWFWNFSCSRYIIGLIFDIPFPVSYYYLTSNTEVRLLKKETTYHRLFFSLKKNNSKNVYVDNLDFPLGQLLFWKMNFPEKYKSISSPCYVICRRGSFF